MIEDKEDFFSEYELNPVEKDIPIPGTNTLGCPISPRTTAIQDRLLSMGLEDSFLVDTEKEVAIIRTVGRKMGRPVITRKMYIQKSKDSRLSDLSPVYRIWVKSINGVQKIKGKNVKVQKVGEKFEAKKSLVPSHILEMAELKAENKMIVDDLDKIKRAIRLELGSHHEIKHPLRTSENPDPDKPSKGRDVQEWHRNKK